MKVRLISYEDVHSWILGKFALKMQEYLIDMGVECDIDNKPDPSADINHHIIGYGFTGQPNGIDTFMITHIDDTKKLNFLKANLPKIGMGICMSKQMCEYLTQMGIDKTKLCYVVPAHDECAIIKKIKIGIASRVYPDGRKREVFFNRFAEDLNPNFFEFWFMGAGWDDQVDDLKRHGFTVVYYNDFVREEYYKFIQSLDYYLYTGEDEGQMGFVDAAAAGVPSIVTPQGYHLDAPEALKYAFWTYEDLLSIMKKLQSEKQMMINSVSDWTWKDYTIKHWEIWRHLMGEDVKSTYKDGLNSHLNLEDSELSYNNQFENDALKKLNETNRKHRIKLLIYRYKTWGAKKFLTVCLRKLKIIK